MPRPRMTAWLSAVLLLLLWFVPYAQTQNGVSPPRGSELDELLQKMVEASGGAQKLESITALRVRARATWTQGVFDYQLLWLLPHQVRGELRQGTAALDYVASPAVSFMEKRGIEWRDFEVFRQGVLAEVRSSPLSVLRRRNSGAEFFLAGSERVDGLETKILRVTLDGVVLQWNVEPETGRIVRNVYPGAFAPVRVELSDWRILDGMLMPFRRESFVSDQKVSTFEIAAIQVNPPVDQRFFAKKGRRLEDTPFNPNPQVVAATTLRVSAPPNVAVHIDGKLRGVADAEGKFVLSNLEQGSHALRLKKDGYEDWAEHFRVALGKETTIAATLKEAVLPGPPSFSLEDVLGLLRGEVALDRVAALIRERGVDFPLTAEVESQIRTAGGDDALLLSIAKARK